MKKALHVFIFIVTSLRLNAQELYNLTQPASTVPKGALGIRIFNESYSESVYIRKISILKIMYGITPKLSVFVSAVGSDYHSLHLPIDFILHDHVGGGAPSANTPKPTQNPFIFNGVDVYAQYKVYSSDGQNSHFRAAVFGEVSETRIASHLAEPELMTHNSGLGGGLIATYLKSHLAVTATLGAVLPFEYHGDAIDKYQGRYPVDIKYGNAVDYDLAFGYLLFPQHYKSYKQTNINLYVEFLGKSYGAADVTQHDGSVSTHIPSNIPILRSGSYVDVSPGIQCIVRSTTRVDFSMGFPLVNTSYIHAYPLYYIGVQRYFFFRKKQVAEK